jgi:hypothetical protein
MDFVSLVLLETFVVQPVQSCSRWQVLAELGNQLGGRYGYVGIVASHYGRRTKSVQVE